MDKQRNVVLGKYKSLKAMVTLYANLYAWEEENQNKGAYRGKVKFQVDELENKNNLLPFFLSKKEAKQFFHDVLQNSLEPYTFYGGKKGEKPIAQTLSIRPMEKNGQYVHYRIDLQEGLGEIMENGIICLKNNNKKEIATIYVPIKVFKMMALEALDYIRHEEVVAQLNGNPLYDYEESKFVVVEKEEDSRITDEEVDKLVEIIPEEEQKETEENPQLLLDTISKTLKTYLVQGEHIALSKQELKDVLGKIKDLQPLAKALKTMNRKR